MYTLSPEKRLLTEEWVNNYLDKIKDNPSLKYMSFSVYSSCGYMFISITDNLRPSLCLVGDEYLFNTEIIFRQVECNFYGSDGRTEKQFIEYMDKHFDTKGYIAKFIKNLGINVNDK